MRAIETLVREGKEPARIYTRGTALRVEGELLRAIDKYAEAVEAQTGVRVTRTAAAEALLRLGIAKAKADGR